MKRLLVTFLSVLYLASALSLTVHVHYCMGKFAGLNFMHSVEERCGKCGMKKTERSKGCCKDDYKTFKINDHQQAKITFDFSHQLISIIHPPVYCYSSDVVYPRITEQINLANAPPSLWRTCPIYILNQDYRI